MEDAHALGIRIAFWEELCLYSLVLDFKGNSNEKVGCSSTTSPHSRRVDSHGNIHVSSVFSSVCCGRLDGADEFSLYVALMDEAWTDVPKKHI